MSGNPKLFVRLEARSSLAHRLCTGFSNPKTNVYYGYIEYISPIHTIVSSGLEEGNKFSLTPSELAYHFDIELLISNYRK